MSIPTGAAFAAPNGGALPKAVSQKVRARLVAQALNRFPPHTRLLVSAIAGRHLRLGDLALSFPALLFALSVRRRGIDAGAIMADVVAGAPLATLAAAAGLPMWTRKLKPEAFRDLIPMLPDGELFRRQVGTPLSRIKPAEQWTFILAMAMAWRWHSDGFAAWVAREMAAKPDTVSVSDARVVGLWAWYSQKPQTIGFRFTESAWHPGMSFPAAREAANNWIDAVGLFLHLSGGKLPEPWMSEGEAGGYRFVGLETAEEVVAEAAAMHNCLRTFDDDFSSNRMQVYSVRRDGRRVAVLSVQRTPWNPIPVIGELKGPCNKPAPKTVWAAVTQWFFSHDLAAMAAGEPWTELPDLPPQKAWEALWSPFWRERGRIPEALPLVPAGDWRWNLRYG